MRQFLVSDLGSVTADILLTGRLSADLEISAWRLDMAMKIH